MQGYTTRQLSVRLGDHDYLIRALSDRQQYSDPDGEAERIGISSALWCLFGQVWPAGRVLAEAMCTQEIEGSRILELGCGLALASLVLQHRSADITASDHHPLAQEFLRHNARQNHLPEIVYRDLRWEIPDLGLGFFDLIIGSDILYESGHAELLAAVISRHAKPQATVIISDPGRHHVGRLSRLLGTQGFAVTQQRMRFQESDTPPFRGRLLNYRRHAMATQA